MQEEWKLIPETKHYAVSNHGRVRNEKTGQVLKPRPSAHGYQRVHLPVDEDRKDFYIHRLVADAFCDHPAGCDVVNHIDFDVKNNRADNLEWTTQRSNIFHSMDAGRMRGWPSAVPVIGIKDGQETLFRSTHEAEVETGCDHKLIVECCKGIRQHIHGYEWNYVGVVV